MAYNKLLTPADILNTALRMVESSDAGGLSLRAVASALGVKAPSLYRYFPDKEALEMAVTEEAITAMLAELQSAAGIPDPEGRFRATAGAYLRFAKERFALYTFLMQRIPQANGFAESLALWTLLLEAVGVVSSQRDDTAAAVAMWSFLHGYAMLGHSGAFGGSGPKGGLERGLTAFLTSFSQKVRPVRKPVAARGPNARRQRKLS